MRIFLTGVSCVGKTTIGRRLSELLDLGFFDLDEELLAERKGAKADIVQAEADLRAKESILEREKDKLDKIKDQIAKMITKLFFNVL